MIFFIFLINLIEEKKSKHKHKKRSRSRSRSRKHHKKDHKKSKKSHKSHSENKSPKMEKEKTVILENREENNIRILNSEKYSSIERELHQKKKEILEMQSEKN